MSGHSRSMLSASLDRPAADTPAHADRRSTPVFEDVYDTWFDFVFRSVRTLGVAAEAVDDVVQEVFLVVHRRLSSFEGRSSFKTWLFGIVLRVARDHRRSAQRKGQAVELDDARIASPSDGPSACLERAEAARTLVALLDELDDDKREVFVLAELEQMSAPEMAEALSIPLNTVYSRLRAARQEFEQALKRHRARGHRRGT